MQGTLSIVRELTAVGDSLMWIVGPGHMVSENTSRGMKEPQVEGSEITIQADNWRFHLDAGLVSGIQFVETHGELSSHYVRFSDREGETLLRAYLPQRGPDDTEGESQEYNAAFEEMRARYEGLEGIEYVRREVLTSSLE